MCQQTQPADFVGKYHVFLFCNRSALIKMNINCAVNVQIATGAGIKYPSLPRMLGCQKWNLFSKSVLAYRVKEKFMWILLLLKIECELRIKFLSAFRANPMAEFSFRAITDINFDLVPVSFVVSYLFAGNTDRQ